MRAGFNAELSSLHVRVSNRGALNLYQDALGYDVERIIPAYYQDGEDAYLMRAPMGSSQQQVPPLARVENRWRALTRGVWCAPIPPSRP